MRFTKLSLAAVVAVVTISTQSISANDGIEVSANMALTSNYLWRGMTQTDNAPAIQGGVDFGYNGFYLGTWASNISWTDNNDSSMEVDVYAGYAGTIAQLGLDYDIGYIRYAYPKVQDDNNFDEVYLGLSKDFGAFSLGAKYSKQVDGPTGYKKLRDIEATLSTNLINGISADLMYGDYEDTGKRAGLTLSKTVGKFDISLAYISFDPDAAGADNENNLVATISTNF